jgi:hypothetical protein
VTSGLEQAVDATTTADDPFGDLDTKIVAALRAEVARRRRLGLPIVVDRGNGVETVG